MYIIIIAFIVYSLPSNFGSCYCVSFNLNFDEQNFKKIIMGQQRKINNYLNIFQGMNIFICHGYSLDDRGNV